MASKPLQYLGLTFDGTRKILRFAAFAKFSDNMRRGVSLAEQTANKYSKRHGVTDGVWRKQLYERYSHLGQRNFISDRLRAAKIMDSPAIKKQLKPLWNRLRQRIETADQELHN